MRHLRQVGAAKLNLQGKKNEKVKKRGIADPSRAKKPLVRETPVVKEAEVGLEYTPLEKVLTGGAYKVAENSLRLCGGRCVKTP